MKRVIWLVFIGTFWLGQDVTAQELKSDFLFDLTIDFAPPQVVGPVWKGVRLISPVKGGVVKSDKINGKLLETSGDWGLVIDTGTFKVDSRLTIQTDDGALIYVSYSGYSHATAKIAAMIGAGRGGEIPPGDYYFRTSVSFETGNPKYAWLNYIAAVGVGSFPAGGKVDYRIYAIK